MAEKVPTSDLPPSVAWVVTELGLVDGRGRVDRAHVRTLGEFLIRFAAPSGTASGTADPVGAPSVGPRPDAPVRPARTRARTKPTKAEVRAELTARIADHLATRPGSTLAEIAAALDAGIEDVSVAARPVDWLVLADDELAAPTSRRESAATAATREKAKAALQAASLVAGPLSHQSYTTLVREGRVKGPSVARIVQLFGSWTSACAEVGVASGEPLRKNYERRWTVEEVLDHVERFLMEPSFKGASHQFDAWRAGANGNGTVPSLGTVRNLVGGTWNEIRTTALRRMRARWAA